MELWYLEKEFFKQGPGKLVFREAKNAVQAASLFIGAEENPGWQSITPV